MIIIPPIATQESSEEIAGLVRKLHEIQQRLLELTGGEVDAVIHPGGQSYLLHEAQEKLATSEETHRQLADTQVAILNALPANIALLDAQGVIVSTNEAWRRFGSANALQDPAVAIGQNYLDVCERATGDCSQESHQAAAGIRAVMAGVTAEFELEYPCNSPTEECWYQLLVTPMGDSIPTGAVVMHLNITERKLAQEVMRQSEERFRGMFSAAATGIAVSTPHGRYLRANDAYCRMVGYTEEELLKLDFATLTHPEDLNLNLEARDELLSGQRNSFVLEKRYLKKGGAVVWTRASVSATHAVGGEIDTLIVIAEDITEAKKSEEALTLFRTLIDHSPDAIEVIDPQTGHILDINQTGCQRLGYSREELLTLSLTDIVDNGDEPFLWSSIVAELKKTGLAIHEGRHRRKDGTTFPIEVHTRYIDLNQGYVVSIIRDITERKKSEARFRLLIDSNAQGVFFWNTKGEISESNDAFLKLVGYTRKDLESGLINWMALTPPEYASLDKNALEQLAKQRFCTPFEKQFIRQDGSRVPLLLGAATFADRPDEGVCFTLDLTERKQAEAKVRFDEQRFRTLVETTTAIVWDTPASGEFTVEQPSWTAFTGQSFEELCGWGWLNAIHPDDQAETKRIWSAAVANRTGYHVEHRLRTQDHTYREMAVNAVPILGEDGAIKQWIGIHTDISKRKQSEERIAEQAALLDKTHDAIMVRDLEGKILFWNKGAERMYGWSREDTIGQKTVDFLYVNIESFKEIYDLTLKRGEWAGEVQHLTKSGEEITVEARWTLINDNDGKPKSLLSVNTDITERKKIEKQFLRAQRMESIGTLAGGIAHDLNNILAPILMSIQLLKKTAKDADGQQILDTIEISAKRGADIVRQVLSFARGLDGQRVEVQPKHLLEEVESIIKDTFPKNIRLHFSIPNDTWTILGDPTQIHQILLNLCVNARDAMPNGGTLNVEVRNCVLDEHYSAMNLHAKAGRYLQIDVADSGTGMPKGVIDKIFEPFFTTKELSKGTGLGLSTVMAIVKSHNGVINVYSETGRGTTFKVYLPAMELSTEATQQYDKEIEMPRGSGETILVIDDEASILAITGQTLRAFGYSVLTATDGAEGVAIFAANRKDIAAVLTDMSMPIMDGPATIRALLRLDPTVKIIAASGLTANGNVAKTSEMGVSEFLIKPYTAETLLKVLKKILTPVLGV
jgi:PAS domain S-box-containing protein